MLDEQLRAALGDTLEIVRHRGPEPGGIVVLIRAEGKTIAQAETAFMGLPMALKQLSADLKAYLADHSDVGDVQIQTYSRSVTVFRANVLC
jgi:hypothetical protein